MDADNWKCELHRLFEIFERESTISLRKIGRCFGILGRPFGDEFRQYFLKMSTVRLDSCFNAILVERQFGNRMQMQMPTPMPSTSSGQNVSDKIAINSHNRKSAKANDDLYGRLLGWKTENGVYVPIEIIDSGDDSVESENHVERKEAKDAIGNPIGSSVPQETEETNGSLNDKEGDADLSVEHNVEVFVKCEPKSEIEEEMMDLPFEVFDPVEENERISAENCASMDEQIQARAPVGGKKEANRTDGKRFKCKRCEYTTNHKSDFKRHQLIHEAIKPFKCENCDYASKYQHDVRRHQRIHVQQKLMGISQDSSNGRYKCTHCDQRFAKWHSLKQHLKKSHKNNQRLSNCKRCMRRFTQKFKKDHHEARCQNRRFECYLCKKFVTRSLSDMQNHLRTHSGVKPFACAICMKCFTIKKNLGRHLNSVHSRIST